MIEPAVAANPAGVKKLADIPGADREKTLKTAVSWTLMIWRTSRSM